MRRLRAARSTALSALQTALLPREGHGSRGGWGGSEPTEPGAYRGAEGRREAEEGANRPPTPSPASTAASATGKAPAPQLPGGHRTSQGVTGSSGTATPPALARTAAPPANPIGAPKTPPLPPSLGSPPPGGDAFSAFPSSPLRRGSVGLRGPAPLGPQGPPAAGYWQRPTKHPA